MESLFGAEFFAGNRERLRTLFPGTAPIIVTANGTVQRNSDVTYAYRQDSSFWYLTGIDKPDIILVMDRDKEYLIVPEREHVIEVFEGAIDHESLRKRSGVQKVVDEATGWKQLTARLRKAKHIATLAASAPYVEPYGFYSNPARVALMQKVRNINADIEVLDLRTHLLRMRMIKQEPELLAINGAIAITMATMKEMANPSKIKKYEHEYELEAAINYGFRKRGARGPAFETIVASGANACVIHNFAGQDPMTKNSLVIVDVGAEVENYAADISRTYSTGTLKRRHKQVYTAVLEAQEYAISLMKVGALLKDSEKLVEQFMGEKLRELGLIKSIERESVRKYFPHATSHFLGLDVHDTGDYDEPLAVGMVLTAEPGIYIPEEGIGVRIEDDILISENGPVNLSGKLPRTLV